MVRNPIATTNLADESAELPNLTEHVPLGAVGGTSGDQGRNLNQLEPNIEQKAASSACQIYLPQFG